MNRTTRAKGIVIVMVALWLNQLERVYAQTVASAGLSASLWPTQAGTAEAAATNVSSNQWPRGCSPSVCQDGDWSQWIIVDPTHPWEAADLALLDLILLHTIEALNNVGYDGRTLLAGYRFRRYRHEYVPGHPGETAAVDHGRREIKLPDAAFLRLRGFYIFHELGHVVDARTKRRLSERFHSLAGSDIAGGATAYGYWLNHNARTDLEEATADAFAVWLMTDYAPGYRPVFWHTPQTADYRGIAATLEAALVFVYLLDVAKGP